MNYIKPSVGVEFTDEYDEAKRKLVEFMIAFDKLHPLQKEQLMNEYMSSAARATSLALFVNYMYNKGCR